MMKNVMTIGVASLALASAALLAPNALAASHGPETRNEKFVSVQEFTQANSQNFVRIYIRDTDRTSRHRANERYDRRWNDHRIHQRDQISRWERRQAVQTCANALDRKTDRFFPGRFGDAEFARRPLVTKADRKGRAIEVSGPVRVSNRGGSGVVPASCFVRNGRLVHLSFDPLAISRGHHNQRRKHARY